MRQHAQPRGRYLIFECLRTSTIDKAEASSELLFGSVSPLPLHLLIAFTFIKHHVLSPEYAASASTTHQTYLHPSRTWIHHNLNPSARHVRP